MGFPVLKDEVGRGDQALHDFAAVIDGAPAAVTAESGTATGDYPSWISWTVPFAVGQIRTVTNSYWGRNMYWSNGEGRTGYILKTGAGWNGPIGHALVEADLTELLPR
jgi:hypothetical protein